MLRSSLNASSAVYTSSAVRLDAMLLLLYRQLHATTTPDARRPEHRRGRDALRARLHAVRVDIRRQGVRPDLHAELFQVLRRPGGLLLGEHGEDARTGLDQDDPGEPGIDVAEIPRERESAHLPNGACQLDTGGPAADDDEGQ